MRILGRRNSRAGWRRNSSDYYRAACVLARKGRYTESLSLLHKALGHGQCSQDAALDLQARIYAQQGFHLNAEACWVKALGLAPETPTYMEALACLQRRRRFDGAWQVAMPVLALVLALIITWHFVGAENRQQQRQDQTISEMDKLYRENVLGRNLLDMRVSGFAEELSELRADVQSLYDTAVYGLDQVATQEDLFDIEHRIGSRLDQAVSALENRLTGYENDLKRAIIVADETFRAVAAELGSEVAGLQTDLAAASNRTTRLHGLLAAQLEGNIERLDEVLSYTRGREALPDSEQHATSAEVTALWERLERLEQHIPRLLQDLVGRQSNRLNDALSIVNGMIPDALTELGGQVSVVIGEIRQIRESLNESVRAPESPTPDMPSAPSRENANGADAQVDLQ